MVSLFILRFVRVRKFVRSNLLESCSSRYEVIFAHVDTAEVTVMAAIPVYPRIESLSNHALPPFASPFCAISFADMAVLP